MSTSANERASAVISSVKEIARAASNKFDKESNRVQQKTIDRIDLFGGDATKRVAEIASLTRKASDEYYTSLQSLVIELDTSCRPLLDEGLTIDGIYEVYSTIKWLNDESEIENHFNASLNSKDLGGLVSANYIPSMGNKMIQQFWHNKFNMSEGSKEILERERQKEREKEKSERAARQMLYDMQINEREQVSVVEGEPACDSDETSPAVAELCDKKAAIENQLKKLRNEYNREKKAYEKQLATYKTDADAAQAEMKKAGKLGGKKHRAARSKFHGLCQEADLLSANFEPVTDDFNSKKQKFEELIKDCSERLKFLAPKVGDEICFGTDPLSKNKKPIEWIIIHSNSEQVYLFSKKILGYGAFRDNYDNKQNYTEWLCDFEKKAFSAKEKKILCKNPIDHRREPDYAFVYRYGDAKKYLVPYLESEPTEELISSINSGNHLSDFYKSNLINESSKGYWFFSKDTIQVSNAYMACKDAHDKWEIKMLKNVTHDAFTKGIRPAVILDRKKLAEMAGTVKMPDTQLSCIQAKKPDEQELRRSLTEKYAAIEAKEDKKFKTIKATIVAVIAAVLVLITVTAASAGLSKSNTYNRAVEYLNDNKFALAISTFRKLGDYKDSKDMITEARYRNGLFELEEKNYYEAKEIFVEIAGYKDSLQMVHESDYLRALQYKEKASYLPAANIFKNIAEYKDSKDLQKECEYLGALKELDSGDYEEALELFGNLSGYKDADKYLDEIIYLPVGICPGSLKQSEEIVITEDGKMSSVKINGYSFIFDAEGVLTSYTVKGNEYRFEYKQDGTAVSYSDDGAPLSEFDRYGNITAHYRGTDTAMPLADYALDAHNYSTASRENKYDENGNLVSAYVGKHQIFSLKYDYLTLPDVDTELYIKNLRMILELM